MKLITWNTCGIRENADFYKRPMILQTLIRLQASVAFLQETHIGVKNTSHIKKIPGWKSFYSVHHPRSKGVAILIKNDFHFEHIKHDIDPTGSYIVLICKLNDKCFTLVNVYNHAKEHKVLQRLSEYLCQTAKGVLIVAGDFNTVLNTDLDREYPTGHTEPLRPYLEEFISSLMLVDVWGHNSPFKRDPFTRFPWKPSEQPNQTTTSPKKKKKRGASRLDMVFMPRNALWLLKSCEIKCQKDRKSISDHQPIVLHLNVLKKGEQTVCSTGTKIRETKAGEICEAEVLKAISSLIECENTTGESLEKIKINKEQKAGQLKNDFNQIIINENIPIGFTDYIEKNGWYFFEAKYMILATILVRRIEAFLQPSFKTKNIKTNYQYIGIVGFDTTPEKMKRTFLTEALSSLKRIQPSPPRGFRIVDKLLPKTDSYVQLRKGCPLTPTLLTLSLKYLANLLKNDSDESVVDVCHHRKCITIYMNDNQSALEQKIRSFKKGSGLSLSCIVHEQKKEETEAALPDLWGGLFNFPTL